MLFYARPESYRMKTYATYKQKPPISCFNNDYN